jgi:hypothetical protein
MFTMPGTKIAGSSPAGSESLTARVSVPPADAVVDEFEVLDPPPQAERSKPITAAAMPAHA